MSLKDAFNFRKPKKEQPAPKTPPPGSFQVKTGAQEVQTHTDLAAMRLEQLIETFTGGTPILTQGELLNLDANVSDSQPEPLLPELPRREISPTEMAGTIINGRYRIEGLLAQGGMGQVFLAHEMQRDIPIVLKLMLRKSDAKDTPFQRFMQECRVTHRLRHPNVVKVYDYGILLDGFKPYLVMEFVEGWSLRQILRRKFALMPADISRILAQACLGLHEVHQKGIIHRDLKPENIMVRGDFTRDDNVKILDFGIAQLETEQRFNETGWAVGSLGYMSPEQIMGKPVDRRTDVYSLGLILYETVTGRPPFKGNTAKETMAMHVKNQHVPPSQVVQIPDGPKVDAICARALAKEADQRYQSTLEMIADLEKLFPPRK
jgi:serine/threonine-protein kinase